MAIRQQINESFAAASATKPMTQERLLRTLADAGLVRKGSAGKRLDFISTELACVTLSQAAGTPADAADVVRVLGDLRADDNGERLIEYLTAEIERAATTEGKAALQAEITSGEERGVTLWDLTLCAGPNPYGWISSVRADRSGRDLRAFRPAQRPRVSVAAPAVRHLTTIGLGLILVAGELLADTLARTPAPTLVSDVPPGSGAEESTDPETKKAAGPGSPNGLHVQRSALTQQTEALDKLKSNSGEASEQQLACSPVRASRIRQPVNPPFSHRSFKNDRSHRYDSASP